MDAVFRAFISWYLQQKPAWEQAAVWVTQAGFGKYGHCYQIALSSENGLGNIFLYESNGMYWVDLEGGNYQVDDLYLRGSISFDTINEINPYVDELINYIK